MMRNSLAEAVSFRPSQRRTGFNLRG